MSTARAFSKVGTKNPFGWVFLQSVDKPKPEGTNRLELSRSPRSGIQQFPEILMTGTRTSLFGDADQRRVTCGESWRRQAEPAGLNVFVASSAGFQDPYFSRKY